MPWFPNLGLRSPGILLSTTSLTPVPVAPVTYGHTDPDTLSGPSGGESDWTTPRGIQMAPTGTGHWLYVDGSVDSSGDGLSLVNAFKTVQEGFDALDAGDSLGIMPGVYPEEIDAAAFGSNPGTLANPCKITKLGTGTVEITGGDAPGGWTVCPDAVTALGNANFANIYYVDITLSAAIGDLANGILMEDGVVGSLTMLGENTTDTDSMLIPQHTSVWWNGDDVGSSISDLTKSAETGAITATSAEWENYTQGDLDGSTVQLNGTANTYIAVPLTSHSAVNGDLVFTNDSGTNWSTKQISLRNLPALISAAGQWGARNTSGSTWRVYYWPHNASSINNVRISQRDVCIDLNAAEHMHFFGLKLTCAAGPFPVDGRTAQGMYSTQQNIYTRDNIIVEQMHAIGNNVGGINLTDIDGARCYDSTCEISPEGRAAIFNECANTIVDGNHFRMAGFTSVSLYELNGVLFSNNFIEEVRSVHGNGSSVYLVAKNLWFHANKIQTKFAIQTTMQDSGNIWFTCNTVLMGGLNDGVAHRGFEDNSTFPAGYERSGGGAYTNITTNFPTVPEINFISNTFLPPVGYDGTEALTFMQYANTTRCTHYVAGNIGYGTMVRRDGTITDTGPDPDVVYTATVPVDEALNILVGTGGTGHSILSNGEGNLLEADATNIWVNPTTSPIIVANSAADVGIGDQSSYVPIAQSWLTSMSGATDIVTKDFAGQTFSWTLAPCGAYKGAGVVTPSAPGQFATDGWSLATSATASSLDVTITTLPARNGAAITKIEYDVDESGTWIDLGAISGTKSIEMAAGSTSYDIRLRAVNSAGNATASATKTATSAVAGPSEPDEIYTAGELYEWWDGRTGVGVTGSDVDTWTSQSTTGTVVNDGFAKPTYVTNEYIQFGDGVDDGLDGSTTDLSSLGTCDIFFRARLDAAHNFMLASDGATSAPHWIIGESGSSNTSIANVGGTITIDGSSVSDRDDVYVAFNGNGWVTVSIIGGNMASVDNFCIQGYSSGAFNAPMSMAQVIIADNGATDAATKRADIITFLNSLDYT